MADILPYVVLQPFGVITHPNQETTNFSLLNVVEPRNRVV